MTLNRAIQLLELEKQYALKQTGFHQQPINKEVAEALDIAIESVKQQIDIVRCKDCIHNVSNWQHDGLDSTDYTDITCDYFMTDGISADDFCSYGERKADNENL